MTLTNNFYTHKTEFWINCPINLNSSAIDEFLLIFLVAAKAKGISYFKNLSELNQKESPRLKIGSKILSMIGVKVVSNKNSIKIYGNPNLKLNKNYVIKNFLKEMEFITKSIQKPHIVVNPLHYMITDRSITKEVLRMVNSSD